MTTRLDKTLKREITVGDQILTVTLSPDGFTIVPKGHRNGKTFKWAALWSGEGELAAQLQASVAGHEPSDTSGDHS